MLNEETGPQITVVIPVSCLNSLISECCKMAGFKHGGKEQAIRVYKTASETKLANTPLADDADLRWDVGANQSWSFIVMLHTNLNGQLTFGWSVPAGSTMVYKRSSSALGLTASVETDTIDIAGTGAQLSNVYHGTVRIGNTSGQVVFRWGETGNANSARLDRDSNIIARRLA